MAWFIQTKSMRPAAITIIIHNMRIKYYIWEKPPFSILLQYINTKLQI
jgi:hypothetical protein